MPDSILGFSLEKSNEKLTGRAMIAVLDEYMQALGLPDQVDRSFPAPGSNRGIDASAYVCTLCYHFADGGRHLEEMRALKQDDGFNSLIQRKHMPGPDAVGNWLRRMGGGDGGEALKRCNDTLVNRYLAATAGEAHAGEELVLDVDATVIEADKGDAKKSYKGTVGYHPMLAFLSDGVREPCCSFVKFRPGNASPQTDIKEALRHPLELASRQGRSIKYFRSDSAAYQAELTNELNEQGVTYTITADLDAAVRRSIQEIPEGNWQRLMSRDGFYAGREIAETIHTMNDSDHAFRLILWREPLTEPGLFQAHGSFRYGALITNADREHLGTEAVIHHHNGRGNAERFIGESKAGLGLRHLPCGQEEANRIWFAVGMLCFNVLKLMQREVLPASWQHETITTLRRKALRLVGKVTRSGRQLVLQVSASIGRLKALRTVRRNIYELATSTS